MSDKMCCVPGCISSSQVLHKFPHPATERERFNSWIYAIGGEILSLENELIYKYRRVCHEHFQEKHLCRFNRISKIAVPTLNMPDTFKMYGISKSKPPRAIQNVTQLDEPSASTSKDTPKNVQNVPNLEEPIASTSKDTLKMYGTAKMMPLRATQKVPIWHEPIPSTSEVGLIKEKGSAPKMNTKRIFKTPSELKLYKKLLTLNIKISKYRSLLKKKSAALKAAKNITSNQSFLKIMENLPSATKMLTLMQFREHRKKIEGRRFTLKEKLLSLSILKHSPKGYRFLRRLLILPAPQTLEKVLSKANIRPGINFKLFSQLKKKIEKMKATEKLCILLFDEMSLNPNVAYNARKDKVVGFVTNGRETKCEFADHAQVFMIRGLMHSYKQPIAYTFAQKATKGPELATQIKEIIGELQNAGLTVVATVCDQGGNNRSAIKILLQQTREGYLKSSNVPKNNVIVINGQEIVPLYDPPHLLKCIRNNLLTKDLKYIVDNETKVAKWSHIELLHKENPGYKGIRLIPKLTDNHVIPKKIPKLKVKYATQICSQAVGNTMGYLADKGILPSECKETADLLLFFDKLFDSVNGSYGKKGKHGKPLLGPVKPNSIHHQVWIQAKSILKTMNFIDKTGQSESVPTLKNWVWTLDGIQVILNKLQKDYNVDSVWMRHLNQDSLENFFGAIRSQGCRDINPTPEKFESAFTTILINSISSIHSPGANCENDFCDSLYVLVLEDDAEKASSCDSYEIPEVTLVSIEEKTVPQVACLQYVCGYFVNMAKKKLFKGCENCNNTLVSNQEHEYIKYREYTARRWLCSPSDDVLKTLSNLQDICCIILKTHLEKNNIKEFMKTLIFAIVDFDYIKCPSHRDNLITFLINSVCKFFIYNYCKDVNKIISGKRECDDEGDRYKVKAKTLRKKKKKQYQCNRGKNGIVS